MSAPPPLLPVVLCGGAGTRLWPLSRDSHPKQFLALTGELSMLQNTILRLRAPLPDIGMPAAPLLICNSEHRFLAAEQLRAAGITDAQILLEPSGRNTAPALTIAAIHSVGDGGANNPVLLAMPADHMISDTQAFRAAVQRAYPIARGGGIVTFGIVPDRPETAYGYIRCAPSAPDGGSAEHGVQRIVHFAEKPDAHTASAYLASGQYLWNSGLFMVRARAWLAAIGACRPDILAACTAAMKGAVRDFDFVRPDAQAFNVCPSDSIDYAVMERLGSLPGQKFAAYAVPLQAGWSDLGAWDALWDVLDHDATGNALVGDVLQHGCEDSLLLGTSRLVAGVGLEHIVVVETPDAVLVVDKRRTQDVKHVAAQLRQTGHDLAQRHRKVHRPWGWYDVIDSGPRFQVKRIVVNPGASLSLQMHYHRAEHWVVVRGTAEITNGSDTYLLSQNESTFIPVGRAHRLANPGEAPLEIIEVQSGDYLGEDDIVRFDDFYGRTLSAAGQSS